ncbi:hypothetical protein [Sphingopyxis sp. L1A2A]|uniref:hypothetical protein n=1 Tax=Sphingopyxis sp. L1A2A TaxID=2502247 RepID=UPI0010F849CA|nr:hypothetical protein [Sphingopyxis sp. L1A2A]
MVVHKLFVVSLAFLMTALLPSVSPGRAAEPEFTPLDEIERVRQAGCGIADFEEYLAGYTSATTGGGWFMRWTAAGYDPQRVRRPLELELSYIWDPARQPVIADREIEVKLRVGTDAALPEVALIAMQRPFPVRPHGIIGGTALATQIFPYSPHDQNNGHGELPLGDLLDYAAGYDTLGWTLIRPSDRLSGNKQLARGTLDIAALRQAVAALPALRQALAAKTPDPKARCQRVLWPDITRY